jgi:hypothetical protein
MLKQTGSGTHLGPAAPSQALDVDLPPVLLLPQLILPLTPPLLLLLAAANAHILEEEI